MNHVTMCSFTLPSDVRRLQNPNVIHAAGGTVRIYDNMKAMQLATVKAKIGSKQGGLNHGKTCKRSRRRLASNES